MARGITAAKRDGRSATMRSAGLRGLIAPVAVLGYASLTWHRPDRPALAMVALGLATISIATWLGAKRLSRSRLRRSVNVAATLIQFVGFAALSYLDGGVASPLGALIYISLPFVAITVPTRLFVPFAAASVALYWAVALLGEPVPAGYAYGYTMVFLGVSSLCAGHARSLASLRRRLTEVSRVDPLTGSLNRRGFDERMQQEISRSDRYGTPVTVVLVDLDSFKAVNDTHGHQVGDNILAWTANTLRAVARPSDAVARLGGDEFAVVLADADPAEAAAVLDRLHAALDDTSPASLGAATYPVEAASASELQHLADQRVYQDKACRAGRSAPTQLPPAAAAQAAPARKVSSVERRRRAISDMGWLALANYLIGSFYVVFLAGPDTPRHALLTVFAIGLAESAAVLTGAGRIARSKAAMAILLTFTATQLVLTIIGTSMDGGLLSPVALGILSPLPLIALTSPLRRSIPIISVMASIYVGVGVVVGAPSGWYIALHLIGCLAIAAACAAEGRTAAAQRSLLTRLSRVDSLTDCLNRRGFEERFDAELDHARRQSDELSLLVLDLDGFKQLNDTRGHAAGDELLCWIGVQLVQALRTHDVVGRLGGDEFVALLSNCPADQTSIIVGRVEAALATRIGASFGVATMGLDGDDFDALYRHADTALYAEKARRKTARPNRSDGAPIAAPTTTAPTPVTTDGTR